MPNSPILHRFDFTDHAIEIFIPDGIRVKEEYKKGGTDVVSPYWAKIWPAAVGLCYFLQDRLHYIKDKKVLELAAGLGLPGIFCASYASEVCISDIEAEAVAIMQLSVAKQQLKNVACRVVDWNQLEEVAIPDVLLLSDINYEPAQFEKLLSIIQYFLSNRCTILLSTPQRLMAKNFINQLLPLCAEQATVPLEWHGQQTAISVFVLKD